MKTTNPGITQADLWQLYIEEERPSTEIACRYGVAASTITYYLRKWDIPRRGRAEANRLAGVSRRGRPLPPETCEKMSRAHRQRLVRMSGDEKQRRIQPWQEAGREWHRTHPSPNIGRKLTAQQRQRLSQAHRSDEAARLHTPAVRAKIAASLTGRLLAQEHVAKVAEGNRRWWATLTKEQRQERLANWIAAGRNRKSTSIERRVIDVLTRMGVHHYTQYSIGPYSADVYVPSQNLVIECDGEYWHGLPGAQERDRRRDQYLNTLGYGVVRLTESEINTDASLAVRVMLDVAAFLREGA